MWSGDIAHPTNHGETHNTDDAGGGVLGSGNVIGGGTLGSGSSVDGGDTYGSGHLAAVFTELLIGLLG